MVENQLLYLNWKEILLFPLNMRASVVAPMVKNLPAMRETWARFLGQVRKIPWRRAWQPVPIILPGESHGQKSLEGYSPWGCKESDMNEWLNTHTHTHTLWSPEAGLPVAAMVAPQGHQGSKLLLSTIISRSI